jgi:hypothetical protein
VQCKLQATSADHTVVLVLKQLSAPQGEWLEQRRHRLEGNAWTPIDESFRVPVPGNARFRFQDRSVSAAPSSLQIRDLVVTEYDTPGALRAN